MPKCFKIKWVKPMLGPLAEFLQWESEHLLSLHGWLDGLKTRQVKKQLK